MLVLYRVAKARYPVFDGTGASLEGGRWNSPGRPVIYAATCLAGSLLELLVHAGPREKLPGAHHCARARFPDDVEVQLLDEAVFPGWEAPDSAVARAAGDAWLSEARSVALSVPALTARPFGRHVLLNPLHREFARIEIEPAVPIVWDTRLFRV